MIWRKKNQQVQIMFSIFQKADKVVVWLGPQSTDSCFTMSILETLNMLPFQDSIEDFRHEPACYETMAKMYRGM
jgi:disulfide bond formation protein DsbB